MKVSGSALSLLQGVSQQVPQDRRPGQQAEQINMISDPVQGLSRRHGSRWLAEQQTAISHTSLAAVTTDTNSFRTFAYSNAGVDYAVMRRCAARPVGSPLPPVIVFNRTANTFLNYVRPVTDTVLDTFEAGGCSAITSIGKYVFMAGNTVVPSATSSDDWAQPSNQLASVVWVRGGAHARKFSVTATLSNDSQVSFSYTTPTSSYPGTLDTRVVPIYTADPAGGTAIDSESCYIVDLAGEAKAELSWWAWDPTGLTATSGTTTMTNVYPAVPTTALQYSYVNGDRYIRFAPALIGNLGVTIRYTHTLTVPNPNYSKSVTDITNAYNSAVTNWIGSAAEAIQPANIAESLRLAAVAAGIASATRINNTVIFDNVKGLVVNDGGDGSLIRGVANEVTAIDQVSDMHKVGKLVKVRAKDSSEAFYLQARSKDPNVTSGYTEVTWVEGAGVSHTITSAIIYATAAGSNIYVASSSALLASILPGTHPDYARSRVGDADSSPLPFFIGKQISYLGVFQDRLLVGAGAVLRCSKIGDYLNFFRSSVLTAPADDPIEMLSQGSEDDVLRHSVLYDRDLVIFADRRQYAITGRQALTPTTANMQVMSSHANAAQVPPLAVGSVIFYGQLGERASSVHQVQQGSVAESPESYLVSSQIDTYLTGNVIEIENHAKPTHLFVRTTGARNSVFCFTYLEKDGQGRVQDAWSRWDFNASLGPIVGMSRTADGLILYSFRVATDFSGTIRTYFVADLCPLTTGLSTYPYLDSIRPLSQVTANTGSVHTNTTGDWKVAFDSTSEWQFVGDSLPNRADLLAEFPLATGPRVGASYTALLTPTNPFIRDRNDKAVTSGTMTITKLTVGAVKSSGFWVDFVTRGGSESQEYSARIVGSPDDIAGRETVTDMLQSVPVGLETRAYTITFRARDWFPLTLTTLEWVGQWFNRAQRI